MVSKIELICVCTIRTRSKIPIKKDPADPVDGFHCTCCRAELDVKVVVVIGSIGLILLLTINLLVIKLREIRT